MLLSLFPQARYENIGLLLGVFLITFVSWEAEEVVEEQDALEEENESTPEDRDRDHLPTPRRCCIQKISDGVSLGKSAKSLVLSLLFNRNNKLGFLAFLSGGLLKGHFWIKYQNRTAKKKYHMYIISRGSLFFSCLVGTKYVLGSEPTTLTLCAL